MRAGHRHASGQRCHLNPQVYKVFVLNDGHVTPQ